VKNIVDVKRNWSIQRKAHEVEQVTFSPSHFLTAYIVRIEFTNH